MPVIKRGYVSPPEDEAEDNNTDTPSPTLSVMLDNILSVVGHMEDDLQDINDALFGVTLSKAMDVSAALGGCSLKDRLEQAGRRLGRVSSKVSSIRSKIEKTEEAKGLAGISSKSR